METYTLNRAALAGHLLIAPKSDVRFYLNGVYLDPVLGALVSTDGSCLMMTRFADLKRENALPVIIPRDALAAALKLCPKKSVTLEMDAEVMSGAVRLTFRPDAVSSTSCSAIDGRYPDYMRVIPATVDGTAGNYDPTLLSRVADALAAFGSRKTTHHVRLYQNGPSNAAWMMLEPTSGEVAPHLAVIMPLRTHDEMPLDKVTGLVAELVRT